MFEKEVKYRLCRVLLANLVGNGAISDQQAAQILKSSIPNFALLKMIPIKLEMG